MFKEIRVKFVDSRETYVTVYFRLPKTKKKRIVNKWKKKFNYRTPDLKGCHVYRVDGEILYAFAHPKAKHKMEHMNAAGEGTNNPRFVWEWDE